jgi:hypothetical protein
MTKIRVKKNQNIIGVDFRADLLKDNLLFEICKLFDLENIYVDIFGANGDKLIEKLLEKDMTLIVFQADRSNGVAIKVTIERIPLIIKVLSECYFDEMNIWDCYTEWEQYLKDKEYRKIPVFGSAIIKYDGKFYLNYNKMDGQKIEIICDKRYSSEIIHQKLKELVM